MFLYPVSSQLFIFPDLNFFVKLLGLNGISLWPEVEHLCIFIGNLTFSFHEMSVILCPFFYCVLFSILSFKGSLCILDSSPLFIMYIANIFSHYITFLFLLFSL